MNSINCKLCNTVGNVHKCPSRRVHGQVTFAEVIYIPNKGKSSKQNTQVGYMKRFGSIKQ